MFVGIVVCRASSIIKLRIRLILMKNRWCIAVYVQNIFSNRSSLKWYIIIWSAGGNQLFYGNYFNTSLSYGRKESGVRENNYFFLSWQHRISFPRCCNKNNEYRTWRVLIEYSWAHFVQSEWQDVYANPRAKLFPSSSVRHISRGRNSTRRVSL